MNPLDSPARIGEIRHAILRKPALKRLYAEIYSQYAASLARCPPEGFAVEIGSGAGFAKDAIPELLTTDVLPYDGLDRVVDARRMPFADDSVRFIAMLNVFHHIADVAAFLHEAARCLRGGGRLFIVDQHPGWISSPIYRYLHHEPYDPAASTWEFAATGPLSAANGALAWIVFVRDYTRFAKQFPTLRLIRYRPIIPLRYWLCGGLKNWSLLPTAAWPAAAALDRLLLRLSNNFGSFAAIEILKIA